MLAEVAQQGTVFASTVSGWLSPVLQGLILLVAGYIGRTLSHIDKKVDRADRTLFPPESPPLTDKVEQIARTVEVLKDRGERRRHPTDDTDN